MLRVNQLSSKNPTGCFVFIICFFLTFTSFAQKRANVLGAFSTESLLLGEWKLIGIEKDAHTFFANDDAQQINEEEQLNLIFTEKWVEKIQGENKTKFVYSVEKDSLSDYLNLKVEEVSFRYKVEEINHFSLLISSEITINNGLDFSTEKIYYTYLRQGGGEEKISNILGNWFICSDSILEDFSMKTSEVYRFYRSEETECDGVCNMSLELNSTSFQLLHNVVQEDEKSFKFLSSSLIVNLDKKLIYFKVDKGLVFDIVNLDENYLEIRLNQELTQRIL